MAYSSIDKALFYRLKLVFKTLIDKIVKNAMIQISPADSAHKRLPDVGLDMLFREARTHHTWRTKPVPAALLKEIYEVFKFCPTSTNSNPCRIVFVSSESGKQRLYPALSQGNISKLKSAPVTAIIAHDMRFFDHLPRLFPHKDMVGMYANDIPHAEEAAFRNGSMQGAYFIIVARALGLDVGPMSGFNNHVVDETFFAGTSLRSNFLCNLGYGDERALFSRLPRFDFDEVCSFV